MTDGVNGGGTIGPGDRFKIIENTLGRIESKLDNKVDRAQMEPIYRRLELIESGETPLAKVLLEQWKQMQVQLSELVIHGSNNAQAAMDKTNMLEERQDKYEQSAVAARGILADRQQRSDKFMKVAVSIVAALGATGSVLSGIVLAVH